MPNYNLGTARGEIVLQYKDRGVKQAKDDVDGLGTKAESSSAKWSKGAKVMALAGAAVGVGFGLAVRSAANFEKEMSGIAAVSGATGPELESLRNKALQLGKDTQFSASESAQAISELIKAGLPVADVLNGAADAAVNLAAAGGVDIPTAATLASNAMNAFNIKAEDMAGVVDSIAGAANASAIDVGQFGQSLQQVGAVANLTGLSFDDTAVAIAELGNAGIVGSDAGTSLKATLMRLVPSTKEATDKMKALGLITKDGKNQFFDAQGKLKDFSQVQGILAKSLKGMTKEQKLATLQTIFGSDAMRAAAVFADQGSAGFDKLATSIKKTSAADVAKTRMDNFSGSLEQMKGSLETAAIVIGTILIPILRSVVDFVTKVLNEFLNLPEGVQKSIIAFVAAVGALLLIAAAIIKVVQFIKAFQAALIAIRAAMALTWVAALGPILLVVAAIAAVAAIAYLVYRNWDTVKGLLVAVWDAIKKAFVAAWNFIKDHAKIIMAVLLVTILGPFGVMILLIKKYWSQISAFLVATWNVIKTVAQAVWGAIKTIITTYVAGIRLYITTVFNIIKTIILTVWNAIKAATSIAWGLIKAIIFTYVNAIKAIINGLSVIVAKVVGFFTSILTGVRDRINVLLSFLHGLGGRILGAIGNMGRLLYNAGKAIIQGLIDGIQSMIGKIEAVVGKISGVVGKFWPGSPVEEGALTVLNRGYAGKQIVRMLIAGLNAALPDLERAMQALSAVATPSIVVSGAPNVGDSFSGTTRFLPPTPPSAPASGSPQTKTVYVDVTNINPVEEPGSVSTTKNMTRLAQLDVI